MKKNYNAGKTHISSYPFCENSKNSWPSQNYIEKDFPVEYLTPIVAREANSTTSLLEPAEVCRTELKPFYANFGTSMRAISKTYQMNSELTNGAPYPTQA
jgi:hypothetical protein